MKFREFVSDMMVIIGCGGIVYGVGLIYWPAAWIAAGLLCIGAGIVFGLEGRKP